MKTINLFVVNLWIYRFPLKSSWVGVAVDDRHRSKNSVQVIARSKALNPNDNEAALGILTSQSRATERRAEQQHVTNAGESSAQTNAPRNNQFKRIYFIPPSTIHSFIHPFHSIYQICINCIFVFAFNFNILIYFHFNLFRRLTIYQTPSQSQSLALAQLQPQPVLCWAFAGIMNNSRCFVCGDIKAASSWLFVCL